MSQKLIQTPPKNKNILGYGYRKSSESVKGVLIHYGIEHFLHSSKKEVVEAFKVDLEEGITGPTTKPKMFRVVIEEIE